jgi:hypothetical protein
MFCPRCGQQAAAEVRFCSRCGLPLDAAAELVEADGYPVWPTATTQAGGALTPRQRGTRKGLMISVGGLLFFGLAALLTAIKEDFFVFLIVGALVFTIGLMRVLYGMLLEGHNADAKSAKRSAATPGVEDTARLKGAAKLKGSRGAELPPARAVPASFYKRTGGDTSDMAAPPSVAEATTRLLEEEEGGGVRHSKRKTKK